MKNRRFALIAFMLVAVLTMSIGFAAYSTTLAIKGTTAVSAEALEFTEAIQFVSATSSNEAFGTASVGDGKTATFTVSGMTAYNDRVHFMYTIKNNTTADVQITMTTQPTPATPSKCTVTSALSSSIIPAGGTITAEITVVLNEDVTTVVAPISWTIEYTVISPVPATP